LGRWFDLHGSRTSDTVFSQTASDFITFDQEISGSINFGSKAYNYIDTVITIDTVVQFDFSNTQTTGDGGQLNELKFAYALFNISDNAAQPSDTLTITFPDIMHVNGR